MHLPTQEHLRDSVEHLPPYLKSLTSNSFGCLRVTRLSQMVGLKLAIAMVEFAGITTVDIDRKVVRIISHSDLRNLNQSFS
jgi:hypothetical protein